MLQHSRDVKEGVGKEGWGRDEGEAGVAGKCSREESEAGEHAHV